MYAIVAPGIKKVTNDYREIENILAIHPYSKFRHFRTEEQCWAFITSFENTHDFGKIVKYGNTFNRCYVTLEYFVCNDKICYNYRLGNVGAIKFDYPDFVTEIKSGLIKATLFNVSLNNSRISSHMIAIWHGLKAIGPFIDVDVAVPDHSIFYAMKTYTGTNRVIKRLQELIENRLGEVSITVRR